MNVYEYALRADGQELPYSEVWLHKWNPKQAFRLMQTLRWKKMYQTCLGMLNSSKDEFWKVQALSTGQEYLANLKQLETMQ